MIAPKQIQGFEVRCEVRHCHVSETFAAVGEDDALGQARTSGRWVVRPEGGKSRTFCPIHRDAPVPFHGPTNEDAQMVLSVLRGSQSGFQQMGRLAELAAMFLVGSGLIRGEGSWTEKRIGKVQHDPAVDYLKWLREHRSGYYGVASLGTVEEVFRFFPDDEADENNWLVCSTSGVHGSYTTLDELVFDGPVGDQHTTITVLVVQPRIVRLTYGDVDVEEEDVPRLRKIVESSLKHVAISQQGNLPPAKTRKRK